MANTFPVIIGILQRTQFNIPSIKNSVTFHLTFLCDNLNHVNMLDLPSQQFQLVCIKASDGVKHIYTAYTRLFSLLILEFLTGELCSLLCLQSTGTAWQLPVVSLTLVTRNLFWHIWQGY